jgi:hypothetical protein
MTLVSCSRCGVTAYDNSFMFPFAKLRAKDDDCCYLVEETEYRLKCDLARDPNSPATERCCPHMKRTISTTAVAIGWNRTGAC